MLKKVLYLNLLVVNFAFADKIFPPCNIETESGVECIINIDKLHPGQSNVGMFAINMTVPERGVFLSTNKKCTKGTLEEDLQKRGSSKKGIAGVIGPKGVVYLIDGHHHTYSLYMLANQKNSCGYTGEVYVYIVDNKHNYSEDKFSEYMQNHQYVWLKDSHGKDIKFSELPKKVSEIGDDPYRSLIKLIDDSKCNHSNPIIDGRNDIPYLEFYWGNKLKEYQANYYDLNERNASQYTINAYNYIVQNKDEFKDLPGFIQPKENSLCKNAF